MWMKLQYSLKPSKRIISERKYRGQLLYVLDPAQKEDPLFVLQKLQMVSNYIYLLFLRLHRAVVLKKAYLTDYRMEFTCLCKKKGGFIIV